MQSIRLHSVSPTLPMQPSSSCTVGNPAENGQKFAQNDFSVPETFFLHRRIFQQLCNNSQACVTRENELTEFRKALF